MNKTEIEIIILAFTIVLGGLLIGSFDTLGHYQNWGIWFGLKKAIAPDHEGNDENGNHEIHDASRNGGKIDNFAITYPKDFNISITHNNF